MAKYRRKSEPVDATQWHGHEKGPQNLGVEKLLTLDLPKRGWLSHPIRGGSYVMPGDWIIANADGTKSKCRPDEFVRDYEPVDDLAIDPGQASSGPGQKADA